MVKRRKSPQNQDKRIAAAEKIIAEKKAQAQRLQRLALAAGYTKQSQLARDSGVHWQTLGSYWNGERRLSRNPENAAKLAAALNNRLPSDGKTTADYLMFGREPVNNVTKVSHKRASAGKPLEISLFLTGEVDYLLDFIKGGPFEWARMITIERPELFFGSDPIPERILGIGHGDIISIVDLDSPGQHGDTVLAIIPALNNSVVAELIEDRKDDGSFRKVLNRPGGPIPLCPDAGDKIVGTVCADFVRRKR
jgi:transcriptional regulator with XRE-family HTH domain